VDGRARLVQGAVSDQPGVWLAGSQIVSVEFFAGTLPDQPTTIDDKEP
jgi:hypothetical protein